MKSRRTFFAVSLFAVLGAGIGLASRAALAEQSPAVSGTVCVAGKTDNGRIKYDLNYGVYNDATDATAVVFCPLTNYLRSDYFYGGLEVTGSVWVWDKNGSSGQDVKCSFAIPDRTGQDFGFVTATRQTTGSSSQAMNLAFDNIDPMYFANGNPMILQCTLPKKTSGGSRSHVTSMEFYGQD